MEDKKNNPVRVILIEDNRFIRNGIEMILNAEKDFILSGSYPSCEDAFYYQEIGKAQIVLMDIMLPGITGIDGIKYLKKNFPDVLTVVCTAYEDDKNIFEAIEAGAVGFISKKTPSEQLISTLRNVSVGGSPMTPNVARFIMHSFYSQNGKRIIKDPVLTEIENQILDKISIGKSYTTVAIEQSINEKELFKAIRSIYGKLQNKPHKLEI